MGDRTRRAAEQAGRVRRDRMAVLARAEGDALRGLWTALGLDVEAVTLRGPETGLVTVRGRIGGTGGPFNLGEATVTRASVKLSSGEVGHAYALGRDREKARIAALVDALGQSAAHAATVDERIVAPLRAAQLDEDARLAAETAATRVEFFTMARGEDG